MSEVPAKTSMRPSGLTLIHACDGSPFWFIPVGYSIAAKPRPTCFAMSVRLRISHLGHEMLGQKVALARVAVHRAVVGGELVPHRVGDRLDRRHRRRVRVDDAVG